MKKYLFCVIIAFFLLSDHNPVVGQRDSADTKMTKLCDIIANPEKYVNKEIRFVAVYGSGFMRSELLSDPNGAEKFLLPSFDYHEGRFSSVKKQVEASLKKSGDGISSNGTFNFTGVLKKNSKEGIFPIDGLLQDYTMIIKSALFEKSYSRSEKCEVKN